MPSLLQYPVSTRKLTPPPIHFSQFRFDVCRKNNPAELQLRPEAGLFTGQAVKYSFVGWSLMVAELREELFPELQRPE